MAQRRTSIFSVRNLALSALGLGLLLGVWLGDLFQWPAGNGWKPGSEATTGSATTSDPLATTSPSAPTEVDVTPEGEQNASTKPAVGNGVGQNVMTSLEPAPATPPASIRVVVDDRTYFVMTDEGRRPVTLETLVELATATAGDADGIRVRINRTANSRATVETRLLDALTRAGIPENAIFLPPEPVE